MGITFLRAAGIVQRTIQRQPQKLNLNLKTIYSARQHSADALLGAILLVKSI